MALLRSGGIDAYLQGGEHRALLGQLGRHIEMRILVPCQQLEAAEALLFAVPIPESDDYDLEDFEDDEAQSTMELAALSQFRRPGYAIWLAMMLPAGTGHLYAREIPLATLLGAVELGFILAFVNSGDPRWLMLLLAAMVIDAVGGYIATLRANRRLALRPAPPEPNHPYRRAFRKHRSHALPEDRR